MAVANMLESLLAGSTGGEPQLEDHRIASVPAGDRVRQSTVAQVRFNTESTNRQYGLAGTAAELGWLAEQIVVVDADLGVTTSSRTRKSRSRPRSLICSPSFTAPAP